MVAALSWKNNAAVTESGYPSTGGSGATSSTFDSAYPAFNMLDADPSKVARFNYVRNSTANAPITVQIRWADTAGECGTTRLYALLNCRLPADVISVKLAAYTHAGGLIGYVGTDYLAADLVTIPGTLDRYDLYWIGATDRTDVGWFILELYVPVSTSSYGEIGLVWAGPALVPQGGIDANWSLGFVDPSDIERARGGALVASQLPRRRRLRASITARDYNTAFGTPGTPAALSLRQLLHEAGLSSPIVFVPRSDSLHTMQTASLYGALTNLRDLAHQGGNYFGAELEVEQIR